LQQWETIRGKRVLAGKASADKRQQVSTSVECDEQNQQVSTVTVTDNVTVTVNDTVKEEIKSLYPFEYFWDLYEKKGNRKTTEARYNKLSEAIRTKIINHVKQYVKATSDKQYRKNAETYLIQEFWNDEIIQPLPPNKESEKQKVDLFAPGRYGV
jgi:hypothetical protein